MNRREFVASSSLSTLMAGSLTAFQTISNGQAAPAAKFTRGVSLYSYQEEYYKREMTLEDCLAEVASIGATGVQVIAEEMVPNYPNPPQEWVNSWHELIHRYGVVPTSLDTFVDIYVGGHRQMPLQESVAVLSHQIELAARLGFKVIRPTTGPAETPGIELVSGALPTAERLNIVIAPEIHAPILLKGGKYMDSYLELIHRSKTKHLGFTLDCGVFCKKIPRVFLDYHVRHGANQEIADFVAKAYEEGQPSAEVIAATKAMQTSPQDLELVQSAAWYGPLINSPSQIRSIAPHIQNIHAKFYEMTDELTEQSIPYHDIVSALVEVGYAHSMDSEFEGQRWTQDMTLTDSCEQVRRQHVMFRRLLGEWS